MEIGFELKEGSKLWVRCRITGRPTSLRWSGGQSIWYLDSVITIHDRKEDWIWAQDPDADIEVQVDVEVEVQWKVKGRLLAW